MAASELSRLVSNFNNNFAKDPNLQIILADYLEDQGDKRADLVRNNKSFIDQSIRAYKVPKSPPYKDPVGWILDYNASLVKRHILSLFPECYPGIQIGSPLADIHSIGVCVWENHDETVFGAAISTPDENGNFTAIGKNGYSLGNVTYRCTIGKSIWNNWTQETPHGNTIQGSSFVIHTAKDQ